MNFKEVMHKLDHFTAPPPMGPHGRDYDEHVQLAMRAVYDLLRRENLQLLRLPHLVEKLSISKSAIRKLIREGDFPKPTRIGSNIDVWNEATVNEWFKAKERSVLSESDMSHDQVGRQASRTS